ncbi:MAG: phosphatase PAP2 family protein [Chitinophagaceae bacterium]
MKIFSGCILLLTTCLFNSQIYSQKDNFDTRFLRNLQEHRTEGKTSFYKTISASTLPLCTALPLTYFVTGLIENNKILKQNALYLTESLVASQIISFSTKAIINRSRPSDYDPSLIALKSTQSESFPSGHTSAAFSTATSMAIISPKWYVIVPAFSWASLVGYSRLYMGVHYPTDVLAGAIVGSGSAWLMYKANKWIQSSKKNKNKTAFTLAKY